MRPAGEAETVMGDGYHGPFGIMNFPVIPRPEGARRYRPAGRLSAVTSGHDLVLNDAAVRSVTLFA